MGLNFPDKSSRKYIINLIVGKCITYVCLITGKTKGISAGSIKIDAVSTIEELLEMTSMAWVTGSPGLLDKNIYEKRKKAMEAKKRMKLLEKSSIANTNIKLDRKGNVKTTRDGRIKFNKNKTINRKQLKEAKESIDSSGLLDINEAFDGFKNFTKDQIDRLAASRGLPTLDDLGYAENKAVALTAMRNNLTEFMARERATNYAIASKEKNKTKREQQLKELESKSSLSALISNKGEYSSNVGETSDKIPVVSLSSSGAIVSEDISKAVPVIIVGNTRGGHFKENEGHASKQKKDIIDKIFKRNDKRHSDTVTEADFAEGGVDAGTVASVMALGVASGAAGTNYRTADVKELSDYSEKTKESLLKGAKSGVLRMTNWSVKNTLSDIAKTVYSASKATVSLKDTIPVYVVNKGIDESDYIRNIDKTLVHIADDMSIISGSFGGLQMAGTAVNAVAATYGVSKAIGLANDATRAAVSSLDHKATGGSLRAGTGVSSFVAGDHPQGRNNTEVVSVDWGNRSIDVKPVPAMATGGTLQKSPAHTGNVVASTRMTTGERNKPLSVGISTGLCALLSSISISLITFSHLALSLQLCPIPITRVGSVLGHRFVNPNFLMKATSVTFNPIMIFS